MMRILGKVVENIVFKSDLASKIIENFIKVTPSDQGPPGNHAIWNHSRILWLRASDRKHKSTAENAPICLFKIFPVCPGTSHRKHHKPYRHKQLIAATIHDLPFASHSERSPCSLCPGCGTTTACSFCYSSDKFDVQREFADDAWIPRRNT